MRTTNGALALVGAVLFETSRALARGRPIGPLEEQAFRLANDAADGLRIPVRAVMQAGSFGAVPTLVVLVALAGRRRTAIEVAVGGTTAWLLAKAAKPLAGRPRPALVLRSVRQRESIAGDLGWVSGHAAVSTTIALMVAADAPSVVRPLLAATVATTTFGRMYVGAHLPLDLVGGVGLGMMIAAAVRTIGDVPAGAAREAERNDVAVNGMPKKRRRTRSPR
jgi:membrane-associated phospholipid phosphatase